MKKLTNMIEYKLKGSVVEADEQEIKTQVTKKDSIEEDSLDLQEFLCDITEFCKENIDKNIEMTFSIKVIE